MWLSNLLERRISYIIITVYNIKTPITIIIVTIIISITLIIIIIIIITASCTIENQNEEEESLNKEPALKKEEIVKNEVKMDKGLHFLKISKLIK